MASVFDGVPALQSIDIQPGLAALMQGLQQRREWKQQECKNLLEDHALAIARRSGTQAAAGDFAGASALAFEGGDPELGAKFHSLGVDQKQGRAVTAHQMPERLAGEQVLSRRKLRL